MNSFSKASFKAILFNFLLYVLSCVHWFFHIAAAALVKGAVRGANRELPSQEIHRFCLG